MTLDDIAAFIKEQQSHTISQNRRKWFEVGAMLQQYRDELARKPKQNAEIQEIISDMHELLAGPKSR